MAALKNWKKTRCGWSIGGDGNRKREGGQSLWDHKGHTKALSLDPEAVGATKVVR